MFAMLRSIFFHLLNFTLGNNIRYFDYDVAYSEILAVDGGSYPPCHGLDVYFEPPKISYYDDFLVNNSEGTSVQCLFRPSFNRCFDWVNKEITASCLSDTWYCVIEQHHVCDGTSICLSDECNCPNSNDSLFFCADGRGCTNLEMACDGRYDCLDKSDEMACDGLMEFTCKPYDKISEIGSIANTLFLSKYTFCSNFYGSSYLFPYNDCDKSPCINQEISGKVSGRENSLQCTTNIMDMDIDPEEYHNKKINFTWLCVGHCKNLMSKEACKNFDYSSSELYHLAFRCSTMKNDRYQEIRSEVVCDGTFDCHDKSDEIHCLDRFYCTTPDSEVVSWIAQSAVCNSYKDCANGIDECSNCSDGMLSSDQFLVRNHAVFAWLVFACIFNLIMNIWSAWKDATSKWKNQPTLIKVDKFLRLQICFYDVTMGFYLLSLVITNIRFYEQYCKFDLEWRYGWICKILGILYNFSSHGSLVTVFLMSLTRAFKCISSFPQGISFKATVSLSIVIAIINISNSVIPVLPIEEIQNIFRIMMTFSQSNPFIMNEFNNLKHVNRIYSKYFGEKATAPGLYEKLRALKLITNTPEIFDYKELSFYSWSPVCVQDMYGFREPLKVYKIVYITVISAILMSMTFCYIIILKGFIKLRRQVNPMGDINYERDLRAKVTFIIGTKLICWLTIVGAMMYYNFTKEDVPDGWFVITAIYIIPINSLLNPVVNSDILKSLGKLLAVWSCKNSDPENIEPENHEPENHEPENHEPENHEPENHEPENHEPENHEPENHEPENHEPENHEPENHELQSVE